MSQDHECLVMAKPAGSRCNMRCSYCYYIDKNDHFAGEVGGAMPDALLERFIADRFAASPGPVTHFEWHGGEPTLLGVPYFERIVELEKRLRPPGRHVSNGIQTNGILLDESWASFLARESFSVGLSLDGPAEMHDHNRCFADGRPTHAKVLESFGLLKQHGVFCNVLCVVSRANVDAPDRVYDFFKSIGVTYLQFLPLVSRVGRSGVSEMTADPEAIGKFLCRIFDRWISADAGRVVVQTFDEALRPIHGIKHALCVHRETCGDVAVLERDGNFYTCDHFVDDDHRVGNLCERSLEDLAADPLMWEFGQAKRGALPRFCRECEFLAFCNGGCPKDRFCFTGDGEPGLNYLCPAYRAFFSYASARLERLSAHLKAGRRLREFRA